MPDDCATPPLHDVGIGAERTHALLAELLLEVRALRAELDCPRGALCPAEKHPGSAIVPLIAACIGSRVFNAAELVEHCRLATAAQLRAALTAACGGVLEPRRIGKLLQRLQSVVSDGYIVRRVGADRDGAVWICTRM